VKGEKGVRQAERANERGVEGPHSTFPRPWRGNEFRKTGRIVRREWSRMATSKPPADEAES